MLKFFGSKSETYLEKRERIRVSNEILGELKKQERLRDDVLANLGIRTRFGRFTRHPAFLVVLSFAVTGLIGTGLSIYWQGEEWTRQQDTLAAQRSLEQKYHVINETAKGMGELQANMISVLSALTLDENQDCLTELHKGSSDWKRSKTEWGVKSAILASQLTVNFPNDGRVYPGGDIPTRFQGISKCYQCLNVALSNIVEAVELNDGSRDEQLETDIRKLTETLRGTNDDLVAPMMRLMAERLQPASKRPPPADASNRTTSASSREDPCSFPVNTYNTPKRVSVTQKEPRFCSSR